MVSQAPFIGGAERSLIRLAAGLDPNRYRAVVICGRDGAVKTALRDAGVACEAIALPPPDRARPFPFIASVARVAVALRRHRAVLLHSNDPPAHPAAGWAARLLGLPRVCHVRFTYPAEGLRWWLRPGFEHALFASSFARRHAQDHCPELFPESRCSVVPNGFDAPPPPDPNVLSARRAACGLADAEALVGYVGRVVETKGVDEFVRMAAQVAARHPRCRFLVVGDDLRDGSDHRTAMQKLAQEIGVAAACRFVGFRDDVWELLHLCDVVVMPSHVEPFGNVAVEAAAAARPVVATRVGGIPEIIRHSETGVLVAPGDPTALAEAVSALLADPDRRAALGARARAVAITHFRLSAHVEAVMDVYDALRVKREA
jgi:glycosyltransferase involved in cell wall biosynthesis